MIIFGIFSSCFTMSEHGNESGCLNNSSLLTDPWDFIVCDGGNINPNSALLEAQDFHVIAFARQDLKVSILL